jgi:hypothetical protein
MNLEQIEAALGNDKALLAHQCKTIAKGDLHLPAPTSWTACSPCRTARPE